MDSNTSKIQLTPLRFWYCVQSVHTLMAAAYTSDKSALKINDKKKLLTILSILTIKIKRVLTGPQS